MKSFVCALQTGRVVFGAGARASLPRELEMLGASRALVLCTSGHAELAGRIAESLGDRACGVFDRAAMHVPIAVAREARDAARRLGADCLIAIGGGSTTGLAKAVALEWAAPIIALPTTYAGSEMTPIFGLTEAGEKRTGRDPRVLPRTVIYDPELTLTLPIGLSVTSALNAIAHAAEGLYARDANALTELIAEEALREIAAAVPAIHRAPQDIEARSLALRGAWLCGIVLAHAGMALHHKLCHLLGGSFNLPHSETHAVLLPHAVAYNAPCVPGALERMARALGRPDPAAALYDLARAHGAPYSLRALGLAEADIDRAAELAVANPYWNPRPIEHAAIRTVLRDAWEGKRPD
jgi:maleylacetate reductase